MSIIGQTYFDTRGSIVQPSEVKQSHIFYAMQHIENQVDDPAWAAKRFRVYCHGDMEEAVLDDVTIEDSNSVCFGQAFIDKLPQPQLETR